MALRAFPDPRSLSLEEPLWRDGHRHFPRLRIDEIRQRKDHAIADPGDDADNRQETEQTGHNRVSGGKLTNKSGWGARFGFTSMFTLSLQESLAWPWAGVV